MQMTSAVEMAPSELGGLMLHDTVSTRLPGGCSTVIVALVNIMSTMVSVQLEFGQSGAPGIGVVGASVNTLNGVLPFFISLSGIDNVPVTTTGAGFCPGAWCWFAPGFPQVAIGLATAVMVTSTSPFPRPESSPAALSVKPLSVNAGSAFLPPFRWTLEALTGAIAARRVRQTRTAIGKAFRIFFPPFNFGYFLSRRPSSALHSLSLSLFRRRSETGTKASAKCRSAVFTGVVYMKQPESK